MSRRGAKEARQVEEVRRLELEAEKIEDILNEDFKKVRQRLQEIRAASARIGPAGAQFGDSEESGEDLDSWVKGSQSPGVVEETVRGGEGHGDPNIPADDMLYEVRSTLNRVAASAAALYHKAA